MYFIIKEMRKIKKELIISSARKLFEKYGIKKTSMDEIASNAGITKKTIYAYFNNKAEIINYFIKEELNNMKKIVEEYSNKEGDFFENVHQGLYSLLTYKNESFFINLINKESDKIDVKEIKENLSMVDGEIKRFIKEILEKAMKLGYIEVQNIEVTTFLIYKMYIALMFEWDEDSKKLNDKEIADNVLQILRYGLKSRKEDLI